MDAQWFFEQFGTLGLMLGALLYDRKLIKKELADEREKNAQLTDRLIEASKEHLDGAITREVSTLSALERITERLRQIGGNA